MRKWVIACGGVLLILVIVGGVGILTLNSFIEHNKQYILAEVERAAGRRVAVGKIRVNLWGGVGARLDQFAVADDPAFGNEPFIRAADLQVNMKLLPLLRKELEVSKVILHRPVIKIIKDQKGQFNFSTLGPEKRENKLEEENQNKKQLEKSKSSLSLLVSLVDVDSGQIQYVDRGQGIDFVANQIDLKLNDIGFDHPVDIDLSAAVFGADKQNLRIKGRVGPVGTNAQDSNLPLEGDLELSPVSLANLEKALPGLKQRYPQGLELSGAVGGKSHFSGALGKNILPQITGTLDIADGSARIPQLAQPISGVHAKINFTGERADLPETTFRVGKSEVRLAARATSFKPLNLSYRLSSGELNLADIRAAAAGQKKPEVVKNLTSEGTVLVKDGTLSYRGNVGSPEGTIADGDYRGLRASTSFVNHVANIDSLTVSAFGGSLTGKGNYDMRQSTPRFAATANVKSMDLTQIFRALRPSAPQNIRGAVNMDLDLTGAGKDWNSIQNALKGKGRVEVVNGALTDINLAASILSGTTGAAPGAVNLLPAEVKNKYPAIFGSKDTEFKELKGSAIIGEGKARTDDLVISAADFETQGKGWFGFDHTVNFRALLLLSEKMTEDILSRANQAKALADRQGRMEIPFDLSGKLPGAKPTPDIGYIAQAIGKGAIQGRVEGLFQKKSSPRNEPSSEGRKPSDSEDRRKTNPKDEILRGIEKSFGQ